MKNFELIPFKSADELARTAALAWLDELAATNRAAKSQSVALSGGRIAQKFFAAVTEQAMARAISFRNVDFFWADERCVPPTDAESNFRVAREFLLAPLKIRAHRIHRIRGEDSPQAAAAAAGAELSSIAPLNELRQPVLDLIFLGLGEDGHVASLFPGEPEDRVVSPAVYRAIDQSPKPPPRRVTLGYPAITAARQVWMLASGTGKETALQESLAAGGRTPFARVLGNRGQTRIFSDIAVNQALWRREGFAS